MSMNLVVCRSAAAAACHTTHLLCAAVEKKPALVLGLATGATMEPVYAMLRKRIADGRLDLSVATTFNLDEYIGLDRADPASFHAVMRRLLFDAAGLGPQQAHVPDGNAPDPQAAAQDYEAMIQAAGGIDLQLLGIGQNGHVGFNEPGTAFSSRCRVSMLAAQTRRANAPYFGGLEHVPKEALTMGIVHRPRVS